MYKLIKIRTSHLPPFGGSVLRGHYHAWYRPFRGKEALAAAQCAWSGGASGGKGSAPRSPRCYPQSACEGREATSTRRDGGGPSVDFFSRLRRRRAAALCPLSPSLLPELPVQLMVTGGVCPSLSVCPAALSEGLQTGRAGRRGDRKNPTRRS